MLTRRCKKTRRHHCVGGMSSHWRDVIAGLMQRVVYVSASVCFLGTMSSYSADPEPSNSITNSVGMTLVRVPAGEFMMSSDTPNARKVKISIETPFYIGDTEVTQAQWEKVRGTTPWKSFAMTKAYARSGDKRPVTYIDLPSALRLCRQLTFREQKAGVLPLNEKYTLPTQAQWEYACRAGADTRYCFGDDSKLLDDYAWWGGFSNGNTVKKKWAHEVGQKKPNAWGLFDVHGNAAELCVDGWLRGGGWGADNVACDVARRCDEDDLYDVGFRVIRLTIKSRSDMMAEEQLKLPEAARRSSNSKDSRLEREVETGAALGAAHALEDLADGRSSPRTKADKFDVKRYWDEPVYQMGSDWKIAHQLYVSFETGYEAGYSKEWSRYRPE